MQNGTIAEGDWSYTITPGSDYAFIMIDIDEDDIIVEVDIEDSGLDFSGDEYFVLSSGDKIVEIEGDLEGDELYLTIYQYVENEV